MKNKRLFLLFLIPFVLFFTYYMPLVRSRLDWRITELRARIKYAIAPPEQVLFQPKQRDDANPASRTGEVPATPSFTPTSSPAAPDATQVLTLPPPKVPTTTPNPLPEYIQLEGVRYERQGWNNCGPATLAMALSYWGWSGDQYKITPFTKPNPRDKNVMPYEMTNYVNYETEFRSLFRSAGDLDLLKRFVASGFPVIVEKGFEGDRFDGWMGHYVLVTGYDAPNHHFTAQDSYVGPNQILESSIIKSYWRAFNGTYIIVYPANRESEVLALLGQQADETDNRQHAYQTALNETPNLAGRDQFFALFNQGTSLVGLLDYAGAASAYDQAFILYPSIPEKERPWRMMWYQTGPYWAYYYTGRYQDVIDLATKTLDNMSEPILEESFYWRGLAFEALGDLDKAIQDYQTSQKVHPGFQPAADQLRRLGIEVKTP